MSTRTTTITTALAAAVVGVLAFGAATPAGATTPTPAPSATTSPTASASPTSSPILTPTVSPTPTVLPTPTVTPTPVVPLPHPTALNKTVGHSANSRTVTMTGTRFLNLAGVLVAGTAVVNLRVISDTEARFVIPNSYDYQAKIAAITVTALSDRTARPTGLTFQYKVANKLDREMAYAGRYWNATSSAKFGYLAGSDCANFASQTLLARGWTRSSQWFDYGPGDWSATWVSSTALSTWLKKSTDLATHLTYAQRDAAVVGDVIQFRWPGHSKTYSSWDHTGIVSKVVVLPNGRHDIYYTSHTLNRQYGGSTSSLAAWYAGQKIKGSTLRIQIFHLLK